MSTVTGQVLLLSDVGLGGNALLVRAAPALSTGVATSGAASAVISATVPAQPSDPRRMAWRICNIGAEAVLVLFYTGSHPNPADAAAARAAGAILLLPNSENLFAADQALPNVCCINA